MSSPSDLTMVNDANVEPGQPRERRARKSAKRYQMDANSDNDNDVKEKKPRRTNKKAKKKRKTVAFLASTSTSTTTTTTTIKREWTYKEKRDRSRWNKVIETIATCTNPTTVKHTVVSWFGCKGIPLDKVAIQACFQALHAHAHAHRDPKTTAVCVVLLNSLANFASDQLAVGKPDYRKLLLDLGFVQQIDWFLQRFYNTKVMVECGLFSLSTVLGSHTEAGGNVTNLPTVVQTVLVVLNNHKQEASIASLACIALRNLLVANPLCANQLLQRDNSHGLQILSDTLTCHPHSLLVASSAVPAILQLTTTLQEPVLQKVVMEETRLFDQVILAILRFGNAHTNHGHDNDVIDIDLTTQKEDLNSLLEHGFQVLSNIAKVSPVGRKLVLEGGFHGLLEVAKKEMANARVQENFLSIIWYGASKDHHHPSSSSSSVLLQGREEGILELVLEALEWHQTLPHVVSWAFDVLAVCFQGADGGGGHAIANMDHNISTGKIVPLALSILQLYTAKLVDGTRNEFDRKDVLDVLCAVLKALQSPLVTITTREASTGNPKALLIPAIINAMKVAPLDSDVQEHGCALLLGMVSGDDRAVLSALFGDCDQASIMHLAKLSNANGGGEIQVNSDALLVALAQQIMSTMKSCPVHHNVQKQGCDFLLCLIPTSQGVGAAMLGDDENYMMKHLTKLANFSSSSSSLQVDTSGNTSMQQQPKWESVLTALYDQDGETLVQKVTEAKNDLVMFGYDEAFEFVAGINAASMKPEEDAANY